MYKPIIILMLSALFVTGCKKDIGHKAPFEKKKAMETKRIIDNKPLKQNNALMLTAEAYCNAVRSRDVNALFDMQHPVIIDYIDAIAKNDGEESYRDSILKSVSVSKNMDHVSCKVTSVEEFTCPQDGVDMLNYIGIKTIEKCGKIIINNEDYPVAAFKASNKWYLETFHYMGKSE